MPSRSRHRAVREIRPHERPGERHRERQQDERHTVPDEAGQRLFISDMVWLEMLLMNTDTKEVTALTASAPASTNIAPSSDRRAHLLSNPGEEGNEDHRPPRPVWEAALYLGVEEAKPVEADLGGHPAAAGKRKRP